MSRDKWGYLNLSSPDIKVQVIEIVSNITFINIYRPPNGSVQNMTDCLSNIISQIPKLDRKDIVLIGDFDIDIKANYAVSRKLNRFSELNNLVQKIDTPTIVTPTSSSTIYLIFCNMTHVSTFAVLNLFLSDHQPIYLVKKMNTKLGSGSKIKFTGKTYRHYTPEAMQTMVDATLDRNRVLMSNDPTVCWRELYQSLSETANKLIP